jgi:Ca2+-binding RTX toxin-like protein
MSFLRRGERRRGKGATAAMTIVALGAFQVLAIIGAGTASAAATCTYNPATDTINITLPVPGDAAYIGVEDDSVNLDAESSTGAILFVAAGAFPPVYENGVNSGQCGSATNSNTVAITVLGSPNGAEFFGIDNNSGGEFNTAIAWAVDMGGQPALTNDQFEIDGSDATDDDIVVTDTSFTLNGGVGELVGVEDIELFGFDGDDSLDASGMTANVVSLSLSGDAGDDWVAPGAFDGDVASGGAGTDQLSYATRTTCTIIDNVAGEAGQDANCDGDLLDLTDENDAISGFEILESGSGNDMLVGSGGVTETFIPGDGDDDVTGQAADTIDWSSSSAAMTIDPANGEAVGQGTDTFDGPLNFVGSDFDDVLIWDGTTLSFSGGAGIDTVDASAETSGVAIDLDALDGPPLTADDLENAIGGSGSDVLLGNDLRNVLWGNDGDDFLSGFAGNDTFFGGLGNDTFTGGDGADTVDFGASPNGIDADVSLGFASGEGDDSIAGIEIVKGSAFNDSIVGGGGVTAANFRITGRAGNDILTGSGANDFLKGGAGNDKLRGLEGGDTLIGGKGKKDKAWGGPGTDVCKAEYEKSCEI